MANVLQTQILADDNRRIVYKWLNASDGTAESNVVKTNIGSSRGFVSANSANCNLAVARVIGSNINANSNACVRLFWTDSNTSNNTLIGTFRDNFDFDYSEKGMLIRNNANTPSGNVALSTIGFGPGDSYMMIVEFKKTGPGWSLEG